MTLPHHLHLNDYIAIVCPSGYIDSEKIYKTKALLESWGYNVLLGKTCTSEHHYFSADDATRLADLQWALDEPNVKAVIMGRGGYGMNRIIDQVDFTAFKAQPKWVIGFSDITVLHNYIQSMDIASIHGPMCGAIHAETENDMHIQSLKYMLMGHNHPLFVDPNADNQLGIASGELVGGNLCMLAQMAGSPQQLDGEGKLLLIEDIGEHYYKVDRMLYTLKQSGQLQGVKGVVVGNFTDMEDTTRPFGQSLQEIIKAHFPADIPIAFECPIGHETINFPVILGKTYTLAVSASEVKLS